MLPGRRRTHTGTVSHCLTCLDTNICSGVVAQCVKWILVLKIEFRCNYISHSEKLVPSDSRGLWENLCGGFLISCLQRYKAVQRE